MSVSLSLVFIASLITAIATGFGAIPFFFKKDFSSNTLGISNALASGLMLAASFMLIYEGWLNHLWFTLIGVLVGWLFIWVTRNLIAERNDLQIHDLPQADVKKMLLIVGVMTIHSITEGIGVGVSYGNSETFGAFITTAIAVHNIPEGLAISLVLVPRGVSVWKAAGWSIFSSLPQPLMAIPAFIFVEYFEPFLPFGLGFAAGAMLWMTRYELIPEAQNYSTKPTVGITITLSVIAMLLFQYWLKMLG